MKCLATHVETLRRPSIQTGLMVCDVMQEHGYLQTPLSNNAVKGPNRSAAGLGDRKPVLDYSI